MHPLALTQCKTRKSDNTEYSLALLVVVANLIPFSVALDVVLNRTSAFRKNPSVVCSWPNSPVVVELFTDKLPEKAVKKVFLNHKLQAFLQNCSQQILMVTKTK